MSLPANKRIFAALAAAFVLCAALVSGCAAKAQSDQKTDAQINRAYVSSVNSIAAEAAEDLSGFSAAIGAGDVASMKLSADAAAADLAKIESLEAPEAFAEVQAEYVEGARDMGDALKQYVDLYTKVQSAGDDIESGAYDSEIAEIQKLYDSGIEHLSEADNKLATLAGASDEAADAKTNAGPGSIFTNDKTE
ncbi:Uncharacterised protein [Slackia heliotrinireducens]|uniref:Lipoprotein n=1 Tax=Slackia heliotrinireducens (strain ATCC 29202 / DSM 20476 / NCTC 11029 / RHS 1) TaxID=471855 RepID=C7N314_SLAHD|nr:hypothetical protein [Slackia heliotrinireducens]ACV21535.1 hypothetical protein Shel_04750 [Slackia heliotrinireducens DSM 20476]VEG99011.1 Uncharacterised protein [Slackia heliotrinireducens]